MIWQEEVSYFSKIVLEPTKFLTLSFFPDLKYSVSSYRCFDVSVGIKLSGNLIKSESVVMLNAEVEASNKTANI
jgi:hypothetical protein